jgi:hypothetical protein
MCDSSQKNENSHFRYGAREIRLFTLFPTLLKPSQRMLSLEISLICHDSPLCVGTAKSARTGRWLQKTPCSTIL